MLVDTYFDRVHWYMLVFHQDEFRSRVQHLFENLKNQAAETNKLFPFTSTLLVVIAVALQYAGDYRSGLLADLGVVPHDLKEQILSTLRSNILDVVSSGSLEAVQICILLGSYYLYHGNPGLAIPTFGCGLRVAQALNLHRRLPLPEVSLALQQRSEARKRCWWAIYEIETFCSMLYGSPPSISDEDCDAGFLDPSATSIRAKLPESANDSRFGTTLLSYKYFMSRLSIIINSALKDLYGVDRQSLGTRSSGRDRSGRLQKLITNVAGLDKQLYTWHVDLPPDLCIETYKENVPDPNVEEELDQDIGACGDRSENHLFRLQALALKIAYENARILIHRPLISFRMGSVSVNVELSSVNHA